jgi:hypothetical protein
MPRNRHAMCWRGGTDITTEPCVGEDGSWRKECNSLPQPKFERWRLVYTNQDAGVQNGNS